MNVLECYKQAEKLLPWNVEHAVLNGEVTRKRIQKRRYLF